ncbi:branched-chain amino acid aminotransferase [Sphingomonas piscis]|uniref:Branched-chain-amino-acid aminotransferase n=1 Tax=Sphingomonas piscis TaxID=2714943 RepID=A0A6G7YNJ3_9SPHN|nr:branched-chain amino acid aminotransferase [Sphingomonas piscis]QIK78313.1 branched-chain amino acid aminotransferase [Sphingomonas piscis]
MIEQSYEDRDGWIWLDGTLVPWREAQLHVLSHSMHYGGAAFEGQRAYDGVIFKLDEHTRRLKQSAELLGYTIPWTDEEINAACNQVVAANGLSDAYVRPIAWRGAEKLAVSAPQAKVHLAVGAWTWGAYFGEEALRKGAKVDISDYRRPAPFTAPVHSKSSGLYMICTIAKNRAEAKGCSEAMMLDWRGQVAEATSANIFFVRDGELFTPTPDCFLDGITRRTVIGLAEQRGLTVNERAIWPEELESFQQCFLTGSAAEVTPVAEIGSWRFEVGDLTRQLARDYQSLVRSGSRAELSNAA